MKLLLLLMMGLEIVDGVFTDFAVGNGLVREGNALMESIVVNGDFILFKVLGAVLCTIALWILYKRFRRVAITITSGIVAFYSFVMIWNFGVTAFV